MHRQENDYQRYENIWVAEFSYGYHGSEQQKQRRYRAQALIYANSQHQALIQLSNHMLNSLKATEGEYEKILPFLQYLNNSAQLEKRLILNLDKINIEQSILVLESLDISERLPIDTGELSITQYRCVPFIGDNSFNRHWISDDLYTLLYRQQQNKIQYSHS
ncbi:hypothetical protein Xsto_03115 [Xenorhabdus stockiae]|uniref:Uncharacterized protein n=1 Tax=Xenorhabdus stockiae TaxID=351614 RepID=A0A2D0KLU5_9GAMM|nr:hypothetical protein [Xenorhabdus stockiae]PHM64358.1 hypothetical protein Xsto_03115 [Xenorhabdus stockiae]